jgi:eukaryotic-like serine/threonine-protein kinase
MALTAGSNLGPYTVTGPLGKGGMGEVWRARDSRLGRDVAIKAMPLEFAGDHDRLARFEREAKVLASLNHPNIASIYGIEHANGQQFLVLELVEGETLAERVAHGSVSLAEALPLAMQIAEAIEAAHEKDIIHRDLKPANIKLTPDGKVKVLDFGLAKAFEGGSGEPNVFNSPTLSLAATAQGVILGTAAYMSPEQARGQAIDKRTDIWAFGCVLYELLTGHHAFRGEHVSDILASVLAREPEFTDLPGSLPPRLRSLLQRCFEKSPKRRWQAIGDVRMELEQIAADPTAGTTPIAGGVSRRVVAAAVAGTLLVAAPATWLLKPAPPAEPRPVVRFDFELPARVQLRNAGRRMVVASPDGRHVAYNAINGVQLRPMDTLTPKVISGTEAISTVDLFFSPDGDWLGYFLAQGQGLQKISIGGGTPVTIAPNTAAPFGASWGRDGNILWANPDGIRRVSADGGAPELVIKIASGETPQGPSLLPDGKTILYSVTRATGPTRWDVAEIVAQPPGGDRKVLVRGGSDAIYVPTGHLVYAVGNVLYAVAFDPSRLETTGGPVALVPGVQRSNVPAVNSASANVTVTDRGTLVYLGQLATAESPQVSLGLVDATGMVKLLNVPKANYRSPRVSPDGKRVAVETITDTNQNVIWVYELSGASAIRRLTQEGNNSRPAWSADSKRIAYGQLAEKNAGIFWQPADGSGLPERLTTAPEGHYDFPESFSADGKVLSFGRVKPPLGASSWALWTIPIDGDRTPKVFFDLPNSNEFGSTFSPDGKWIAYASNADPNPNNPSTNFQIYVKPYPENGVKYQISETAGTWPIWTSGGRELIYRPNVDAGGTQKLNAVTISTSPAPAFTSEKTLPITGFQTTQNYREYDMVPGTGKLVMTFPATRDQGITPPQPRIHIVQNWTEELKTRVPTAPR